MSTTPVVLDDRFARELPEMAVAGRGEPTPEPRLLVLNEPLALELGLDPDHLRSPAGLALLTGTAVPDGAHPVAQAYSGHQFGSWNPRLGDGRALLLGELPDGRDLHLKGSGRTPFARGGDGLAAVGPMLREHVVSEAMHALGIPTTRSLAVVATGRGVQRERVLPGAVLARVAASHLRVGSVQYAKATGDTCLLRRLADHAISRHHPAAAQAHHPYAALLDGVIAAQASLVAQWMLMGFIHGVMNTDNMTLSGETIDFGPCAFMEAFDPATVFSSIDHGGRYAFGNQPPIAEWNLTRLAEALVPVLADDEQQAVDLANESLGRFRDLYLEQWIGGMRAKLGLPAEVPVPVAETLVQDLLDLMEKEGADHTSFYRDLSAGRPVAVGEEWVARWRALGPDTAAMDRVNPVYVPRNLMVEDALADATAGDLTALQRLLDAVSRPYDERPGLEAYAMPSAGGLGGYQSFCGT